MRRLGVRNRKQLLVRMATGEHLLRHSDGGRSSLRNIVMACLECNQDREPGHRDVLGHVKAMRQKHCLNDAGRPLSSPALPQPSRVHRFRRPRFFPSVLGR
jgi:hypothetical protein